MAEPRIIARPDARSTLEAWAGRFGTLERAAAAQPGAETRSGRGAVHVVDAPVGAPGERWAVRHYRRGGAVAGLLGDRYLRLGPPRPLREFRLGNQLRSRGIDTPEPVGAAVYAAGPFYRGDLVTRYIPEGLDLGAVLFGRERLPEADGAAGAPGPGSAAPASRPHGGARPGVPADPAGQRAAMAAAGRLVAALHRGGVVHRDLNIKNILVTGAGDDLRAHILDLDAARMQRRVRWLGRRRMLRRFWRSVAKWERRTRVALDGSVRAAFLAAYDDAVVRRPPE